MCSTICHEVKSGAYLEAHELHSQFVFWLQRPKMTIESALYYEAQQKM